MLRSDMEEALSRGLRRVLREEIGVRAVSNLTGIPLRTLQNFVRDKNPAQPSAADLILIAQATGRSISDIVGSGVSAEIGATPGFVPDQARELARVPRLSLRASAGAGQLISEVEDDWVAFPRSLLNRLGLPAEHAAALEAVGDSMAPTIQDGDLVIIDRRDVEPVENRVFVLSIGDEAFVKRLRRIPGAWQLVSDNPEVPPFPAPADAPIRIYGRVRWTERAL